MAMDADCDYVFAVWLDLRGNKRNKIYGARSVDGGKTWKKNILVYASPDGVRSKYQKHSFYSRFVL